MDAQAADRLGLRPEVKPFFDRDSATFSYILRCPDTGRCAIIDPVRGYDPASGRTCTGAADEIAATVREAGLTVDWILETHAHADHVSAAPYLKAQLGGRIAIGAQIVKVQESFAEIFNLGPAFVRNGSQFDRLLADGEHIEIGTLTLRAMHTPGHTPACMTYLVGDAAFVGDTLFMPDSGTARCDFPGGDARTLYRSIRKILALPEETRLFVCHDYAPGGREHLCETTVGAERRENIHVGAGAEEESFVRMRTERDATLAMPRLLLPSIQLNIRAGSFPPPESNGISYIKLPLDAL